jgi:hypothetical protein
VEVAVVHVAVSVVVVDLFVDSNLGSCRDSACHTITKVNCCQFREKKYKKAVTLDFVLDNRFYMTDAYTTQVCEQVQQVSVLNTTLVLWDFGKP